MNSPTPRQQAGYLRRLLRRGEIQLIDPFRDRAVPARVELTQDTIRLIPVLPEDDGVPEPTERELRWRRVTQSLRDRLSLEEAEELAGAVELENQSRKREAKS